MTAIQMDLFDFFTYQVPKVTKGANKIRNGRHLMPTMPKARIETNLKAIRLLKALQENQEVCLFCSL